MRAGRAGGLVCSLFLCVPLLAQAEGRAGAGPLAVALEYTAAPGCLSVSEFKAIAVGRLGYDAFREDATERVVAQIESHGPSFEGRIEWRNAEGKWAGDRVFPSRSAECRELARAMAFALALQIQLLAKTAAPPPPATTTATETDRTAETPAAPPAPPAISGTTTRPDASHVPPARPPTITPSPSGQSSVPSVGDVAKSTDRSTPSTLAVGAGALVGFGLSSKPVALGRLLGSIAWPHWSLELAADVGWPSTVRRADGAGFSQQELLMGIAGCGTLSRLSTCLLARGGAIRIVGSIDAPASPWGPIFETGLRLAVTQPLGSRVYLDAQVEGLLLVTRWRVTLDNIQVWASSRFAETIGLDVGVRFQ